MASPASIAQKHERFQTDYLTLTVSWDGQVAGRVSDGVQAAMTALCSDLLDTAKDRAPVRSHHLVDDSGVVMNEAGTEWRIQFRAPYARRQHYAHPTGGRWPGMRSRGPAIGWGIRARSSIPERRRWLSDTLRDVRGDFDREIAARVMRAT